MLGLADRVRNVGLLSKNAFFNGFELPWPTTVTFLEGMDDHQALNLRKSLQVTWLRMKRVLF